MKPSAEKFRAADTVRNLLAAGYIGPEPPLNYRAVHNKILAGEIPAERPDGRNLVCNYKDLPAIAEVLGFVAAHRPGQKPRIAA
jgi:hypothetical protein